MRHCSPDELIEVVEGLRPAASLPHLAICDTCRAQADELRALMSEVGNVPVPEPSPLFWDHLSARVREAVAAEPPPTVSKRARIAESWMWRPMWTAAAVAAAAVLLVLVAPRGDPGRSDAKMATPAAAVAQPTDATSDGSPASAPSGTEMAGEPLLAFIADLAAGIDLDAAVSEGWPLDRGTTDAAVTGLSGDEQVELQRLLQEALAGSGAGPGA